LTLAKLHPAGPEQSPFRMSGSGRARGGLGSTARQLMPAKSPLHGAILHRQATTRL